MSTPHMYIKLDEIGSAIWRACDGKNTVYDISRKLEAEFGAKVNPVYERLSLFFRELERSKFIRWKNLQK